MVQRFLAVILLLVLTGVSPGLSLADQDISEHIRENIRTRLESQDGQVELCIGTELIYASSILPEFYIQRAFRPAWSDRNSLLPQASFLIKRIRRAAEEGLRPEDYHLSKIKEMAEAISNAGNKRTPVNHEVLADLDLLLTDAFLVYGSHLLNGRVDPVTIDPDWQTTSRRADLSKILQSSIEGNSVSESLLNLLPQKKGYSELKKALAAYREISARGGWNSLPDGPAMREGDHGIRVTDLTRRLVASGDLPSDSSSDSDVFTAGLKQGVISFQQRHGLKPDGIVGPKTLAELNIQVDDRIRQIEINLERWRWLPRDLGKKYILVNIANYELSVIEDTRTVMTMRVVVGRQYRKTPVFSDMMTYLVLNPYWNVPHSIAVKDKLPLIRKEPDYLQKQKIKVFFGWGTDATEIDPDTIDWSSMNSKDFIYRLRQEPGPLNALGRIKFMFPNKFSVYLHDTPSRELFTRTERGFSSGCIRIEKPLDLAEYLLKGNQKWSRAALETEIGKTVEQTVSLPNAVPVHLLYWTSWVDNDGNVQFRPDIYDRDRSLAEALHKEAPTAVQ